MGLGTGSPTIKPTYSIPTIRKRAFQKNTIKPINHSLESNEFGKKPGMGIEPVCNNHVAFS